MNITHPPSTTGHASDKTNPRTEAALHRLHKAMREIEAEIEAHNGIYPFNHGRVTQSELCRRADVKKATLQNPVHKDTTRVDIMAWLDHLAARLSQTRDGTRERVTAAADHLAAELEQLNVAYQDAQERLAEAEKRIELLEQVIASLRAGHAGQCGQENTNGGGF